MEGIVFILGPSQAKYGYRDIKKETNLRLLKSIQRLSLGWVKWNRVGTTLFWTNAVHSQPLDTFPSFLCQIAHCNVIECTSDTNFESKPLYGTHSSQPGFWKKYISTFGNQIEIFWQHGVDFENYPNKSISWICSSLKICSVKIWKKSVGTVSASFKSTQKTTATYRQTFFNHFFVLRNVGYISVVNPTTIFYDHFTFSKSNVGEKVKYKYGYLNLLSFLYYYYFLRRCKPHFTLICPY